MIPEINLFGAPINVYALCISIGLIAMCAVSFILGRKHKISFEDILFGELFILIGAFLGAHLLFGITNISNIAYYLGMFFEEGWDAHYFFDIIFKFLNGMVFYGGLILGIVFGVLYCKFRKLDFGNYSDCFAVGIPLFHAITRIGCFFAGYSYGIESSFGFADADGVCRFPVQLLEAGVNIAIFIVLLILFRKGIKNGQLLYIYLLCYGSARFFIEFLRGDESRGFLLFLSTSQWISIILIAFAVYKLFIKEKIKKTSPKE